MKAMLPVLLLLAAAQARVADAVFAGAGNSVHMAGIGLVWKWSRGWGLGDRRRVSGAYSLSCRFEHMSNGGIVWPNQGVNLSELHIAYFF